MPAKKAPKKTAAKKKAATKKVAAKKTATRKGPAKKAAAKKAAPKKAAAKKASPKKAAPKKAAAKKAAPKKAAKKKASPKKAAKKKAAPKKQVGRKPTPSSPELNDVACQLASLALAQEKSPLGVRQVEQLRRALAKAGEALGWIENLSEKRESMAQFSRDVLAMAKSGAKSHGKDLAEQLATKKVEVAQLNEVIEYAREIAEDSKTEYPVDITFAHTIRDAYQSYVTKTETRVANDADEARAAAAAIERSLTSWTKLADAMVVDLKKRQKEMAQVPESLPDFVASVRGLIGEVVANLE